MTLPEEMSIWVSEWKPTSSAQAGQLAEDYLQARKLPQATGTVDLPEAGQVSYTWTAGLRCHACGDLGHLQ